jgi:hypothetical protein
VMCESPTAIPLWTKVDFVSSASGQRWPQRLADSMTHVSYPTQTWLSPVNRRQTFFHVIDGPAREGDRWRVPRAELPVGKIQLTPMRETGCVIVRVDARDIDLRPYAR